MSYYYWQIGGWQSHVVPLPGNIPRDPAEIAERLFRYASEDGVLTLTLGIQPNGASYLLLHDNGEVHPEVRAVLRGRGHGQARFVSLSPVTFVAPGALVAKLNLHAQKYKKNKKRGNAPDCDRSQANTHYTSGGEPLEVLSVAGLRRASFEYHRVFYRLCRGSIDPNEHGIQRVPWLDNIRARSFAYNTHIAGHARHYDERKKDPRILDVGVAEWILPGGSIDLTVERSNYFTIKSILTNPNKGQYLFGEATQGSEAEISAHLKECFKHEDGAPIILFVNDAEEALDVLSYYGVDTRSWTTHLEPVLGRPVLQVRERYSERHEPKQEDRYGGPRGRSNSYYGGNKVKSERSRSPQRRGNSYQRARSPLHREEPSVIVVDVPGLYETMKSCPPTKDTLLKIAEHLQVKLPDSNGKFMPNNGTGWCAGNECRLLAYIWRALVEGNALDQQFVEVKVQYEAATTSGAGRAVAAPVQPPVDDDDVDPNDVVPAPGAGSSGQGYTNPYDSGDEDYEAW